MNKFYYLEDMTQEELNKLALERNVLQSNWNNLKEWLEILIDSSLYSLSFKEPLRNVLDKMNELEKRSKNEFMDKN